MKDPLLHNSPHPTLVSIIMPVYNGELYILEAIQSVRNQTYTHWQLLIVDDGSTDKTEEIVAGVHDLRINYFKQTNKGVGAARNAGLANAQGEFICFLDADDVLTPNSLQDRLIVFNKSPQVQFVDGSVYVTSASIDDVIRIWKPSYRGCPKNELLRLKDTCFVTGSWMIRKEAINNIRFRENLSHSEDLLFLIEISNQHIYDFTDEPIMYFRRTGASAMSNLDGLAQGYLNTYTILSHSNLFDSIVDRYFYKIIMTKVMVLSYLNEGKLTSALRFIIKGLLS